MNRDYARRIAEIASDPHSGASHLLDRAVDILKDALQSGEPIAPLAVELCRAQPAMGSLWSAAAAAIAAESRPERFDRFASRVGAARKGLLRFAVAAFTHDSPRTPLHLVTLSASQSVVLAIEAVVRHRHLRVSCSESRPALEGRALAAQLATAGIEVTMFADAAIGHALASADAVLVGADAVAPQWFLNKSGTRMLAAAAAQSGIAVYVAATRDKFVGATLAARLHVREGDAAEIWSAPPAGVDIRNPYFETTPLELVTGVITDIGVLGAAMVPDVCEAAMDRAAVQALLDELDAEA